MRISCVYATPYTPTRLQRRCDACATFAQLVLSGDADPDTAQRQLFRGIEQLSQVLRDPDSRLLLSEATAAVSARDYYPALRHLRALLPREARLMQTVPS
jgi:flagellar biosynthesis repressor protein FlbT